MTYSTLLKGLTMKTLFNILRTLILAIGFTTGLLIPSFVGGIALILFSLITYYALTAAKHAEIR